MVLSIMSQFFGLSSEPAPEEAAATRPRPLAIAPAGSAPPRRPALAKTKSDELLRDFESMRFLSAVDECLKVDRAGLTPEAAGRLEALYAQATADDCTMLLDILDHFETELRRLRADARCGAASSAAPVVAPAGRC